MHAALNMFLVVMLSKGSMVDASKLRFDFSDPKAVTKDEIKQMNYWLINIP